MQKIASNLDNFCKGHMTQKNISSQGLQLNEIHTIYLIWFDLCVFEISDLLWFFVLFYWSRFSFLHFLHFSSISNLSTKKIPGPWNFIQLLFSETSNLWNFNPRTGWRIITCKDLTFFKNWLGRIDLKPLDLICLISLYKSSGVV
jgi:hypothetical protein